MTPPKRSPANKSVKMRGKNSRVARGARSRKARNDGSALEQLVQVVEQKLLPSGLRVESRVRPRDAKNAVSAEFDLIICGPLGSSTVNWLIECRDRPSSGAAPASWIEQLIGRKTCAKFDKVIAVSTTGFSSHAKRLAEEQGILLRTVERLLDIKDDFSIGQIKWRCRFTFDDIGISKVISAQVEGVDERELADPANVHVRPRTQENFEPLDQIVYRWVEEQILPTIDRQSPIATVTRHLFKHEEWLDACVNGKPCRLKDVFVPVEVTASATSGKALLVRRYAEGERDIAHIGHFSISGPDGPFIAEIQVIRAADGTTNVSTHLPEGCPFDKSLFEVVEMTDAK